METDRIEALFPEGNGREDAIERIKQEQLTLYGRLTKLKLYLEESWTFLQLKGKTPSERPEETFSRHADDILFSAEYDGNSFVEGMRKERSLEEMAEDLMRGRSPLLFLKGRRRSEYNRYVGMLGEVLPIEERALRSHGLPEFLEEIRKKELHGWRDALVIGVGVGGVIEAVSMRHSLRLRGSDADVGATLALFAGETLALILNSYFKQSMLDEIEENARYVDRVYGQQRRKGGDIYG